MTKDLPSRALLLTVGTGDIEKQEETLFKPLGKSIQRGEFDRIILLPSQRTHKASELLREGNQGKPIEIRPLPEADQENDVDACFVHFESVIAGLCEEGFHGNDILLDFTRGTKAMSAALVLAGLRHDVPRLRYTKGERDQRGMVKPGSEQLAEFRTTAATGRKLIDSANQFFQHGNFAAALEILSNPAKQCAASWPQDLLEAREFIQELGKFYAAWDRLDYGTAAAVEIPKFPHAFKDWSEFVPSEKVRKWVRELSELFPEDCGEKAERLRLIAIDLLANGERRIRDRQYEDAVLRAYRVLELMGQIRLFDQGLDSDRLPEDHKAVKQLQEKLQKEESAGFGTKSNGTLTAGRELVARLLKEMGDGLGQSLLKIAKSGLKITARNHSVLIHGFAVVGPSDETPLRDQYRKLEELLIEDSDQAAVERRLSVARSADFSSD